MYTSIRYVRLDILERFGLGAERLIISNKHDYRGRAAKQRYFQPSIDLILRFFLTTAAIRWRYQVDF